MAQKSETPALVLAFLMTAGVLGGGFWWLTQKAGVNVGGLVSPNSNPSSPTTTTPAGTQTFDQVENIPSGLFNYGGSTTWAPIRGTIDRTIQSTVPIFQLRYTDPVRGTPGSSSGIRMLLDDQLAFSQSSRPIEDKEYQSAQQRGFSLKQVPIALEGIAIAVNPSLSIPGLTLDQVKGIYTGKITNWNQVSGPNLPITPYSRRLEDGGTVEFFVNNVLAGEPLGQNVKPVYSTTDALGQLGRDRGGIYYASAPEVVPQCTIRALPLARPGEGFVTPYKEPLVAPEACPQQRNQINSDALKSGAYPITRQLFVVIKQNGQVEQQAGEAYANLLLTNQGQESLSNLGFVRIR